MTSRCEIHKLVIKYVNFRAVVDMTIKFEFYKNMEFAHRL